MSNWLTIHVQSIRPDQFPDISFWNEFASLVRVRVWRRGLFDYPPQYLGYLGQNWDEVFQDLVFDSYQFAILDRLVGLRAQLKVKPNIDGLILRNVDHFLLERQRRQDRLGYAVFRNLEAAIAAALELGRIHVTGRRENRIRNETVVQFDVDNVAPSVSVERLRAVVRGIGLWQQNLPDFARISEQAQQILLEGFDELRSLSVSACRVKDLADALKGEVRSVLGVPETQVMDINDVAGELPAEFLDFIRTIGVGARYDVDERFQDRVRRMREQIIKAEKRADVLRRVDRLFLELVAVAQSEEPIPSHAELSRRIGLPKSSVSDYIQLIRAEWKKLDGTDS